MPKKQKPAEEREITFYVNMSNDGSEWSIQLTAQDGEELTPQDVLDAVTDLLFSIETDSSDNPEPTSLDS
jgi:hypothetical protein